MTTTLPTIIIALLAFGLGGAIGAAWGLSRHTKIYDWFAASFISRMQRAMRSLGYGQDDIDRLTEWMGLRIMPPNVPPPPAPTERKETDVLWNAEATVPASEGALLSELTDRHRADILRYAAQEDYDSLQETADSIKTQWQQQTHIDLQRFVLGVNIYYHDYKDTGRMYVTYTCAPTDNNKQ